MANRLILRAFAILIVVVFYSIGLANLDTYGFGDHEEWMVKRGALAFQIVRNAVSGHAINPSAFPDKGEDWDQYPSGYALVNYKLVSESLRKSGLNTIESYHLLNISVAALGLYLLYMLAREMKGDEIALYAMAFLAMFPRFWAYAQFNSDDIPTMVGVTFSHLLLYKWIEHRRPAQLIGAGALMGIAASTNLNALILVPVSIIAVSSASTNLAEEGGRHVLSPKPQAAGLVLTYLYFVMLFLVVGWPPVWIEPMRLIQSFRHSFMQPQTPTNFLFFGKWYNGSNAPWDYLPIHLLAATPLLTLVCILFGISRWNEDKRIPKLFTIHLMLLSWAALPVVARMNPWIAKENGISSALIAIPPLMIYAGWGFKRLMETIKTKIPRQLKTFVTALTGLGIAVYFCRQIVPLHPYEGSYFNEVFQAAYSGEIENHFQFPLGLDCYRQGIDWLNNNATQNAAVSLPRRVRKMYRFREDLTFRNAAQADYLMVTGIDKHANQLHKGKAPVFEVRRYNSRILAVFEEAPEPGRMPTDD